MSDNRWICPLCGGTKYQIETESNYIDGPGYQSHIVGYECDDCSIKFGSPEKFNFNNVFEEEMVEAGNEILEEIFTEV